MLRGAHTHTMTLDSITAASMQLEVVASFTMGSKPQSIFGVDVLAAMDGSSAVSLLVDCSAPAADADCHVVVDATGQGGQRSQGPLLFGAGQAGVVTMHAVIDHSIIELIVNNRTAIVAYATPPSDDHTGVRLFGATATPSMDYWLLDGI